MAEEAQRLRLRRVVGVDRAAALSMSSVVVVAVDERPDEAALVEQMHALRRRVDVVGVRACAGCRARGTRDQRSSA